MQKIEVALWLGGGVAICQEVVSRYVRKLITVTSDSPSEELKTCMQISKCERFASEAARLNYRNYLGIWSFRAPRPIKSVTAKIAY